MAAAVYKVVKRLDFSLVLLVLVLVLFGGAIGEMARAYPDAGRGLVIYAREQKDLFVDSGLVQASFRARASSSLTGRLRAQTVIVATQISPHSAYMGAGVIIGARNGMLTILTAKHVIAHAGKHFVVFPNHHGRFAARVVPARHTDLALVYVRTLDGVKYSVARIGERSLTNGETFVVMGHPGVKDWTASPGVAEEHLHETLLFCPTCDRGDSGAGAFDKDGTLRGIVVTKAIMRAPSTKTWDMITLTAFEVERPEAIRAFLRTANS